MTRINAGVNPKCLTDEHLLAEHREIKRICYLKIKRDGLLNKSKAPDHFTLGKGHALFFVEKKNYTLNRYREIHKECVRRGFKVEDYSKEWKKAYSFNLVLKLEYTPSNSDYEAIIERISDRITNSVKGNWMFMGLPIDKSVALKLLKSLPKYYL